MAAYRVEITSTFANGATQIHWLRVTKTRKVTSTTTFSKAHALSLEDANFARERFLADAARCRALCEKHGITPTQNVIELVAVD